MLKIFVTLTIYIVGSRISAKTSEGKEILSHTHGEPYFFTFGKSEVGELFSAIFVSFLFDVCYSMYHTLHIGLYFIRILYL